MSIALEYIICQHEDGSDSHAIKSHTNKNQNPGLSVSMGTSQVTWTLLGVTAGTVDPGHPNDPAATRLDFYISKSAFLQQRHLLPVPTISGKSTASAVTNPTGTQRRGGKEISWSGPLAKLEVQEAMIVFPTASLRVSCDSDARLNIDWEPAMYPLADGTRQQLHFGVEATWTAMRDARLRTPRATIKMTAQQYADIFQVLNSIK